MAVVTASPACARVVKLPIVWCTRRNPACASPGPVTPGPHAGAKRPILRVPAGGGHDTQIRPPRIPLVAADVVDPAAVRDADAVHHDHVQGHPPASLPAPPTAGVRGRVAVRSRAPPEAEQPGATVGIYGQARGPRRTDRAHRGPHHRGRPSTGPGSGCPLTGNGRRSTRSPLSKDAVCSSWQSCLPMPIPRA